MIKKVFAAAFVLFLVLSPLTASAQSACSRQAVEMAEDKLSVLPKCISQIYIWSLGIAGVLALLMTVVGGYKYMTSAGNAEKASSGVEMMWGSVIGLALLFGSYLLLNTINPDLVNFKIGDRGICSKDVGSSRTRNVVARNQQDCETQGGVWTPLIESNSGQPTQPRGGTTDNNNNSSSNSSNNNNSTNNNTETTTTTTDENGNTTCTGPEC